MRYTCIRQYYEFVKLQMSIYVNFMNLNYELYIRFDIQHIVKNC